MSDIGIGHCGGKKLYAGCIRPTSA